MIYRTAPLPTGGVLPYISYMAMCCREGYGFQAVLSGIWYRNKRALVYNWVSFSRILISCFKNLVKTTFSWNSHSEKRVLVVVVQVEDFVLAGL